jgi:GNAT superfamily N-acetyltransferase
MKENDTLVIRPLQFHDLDPLITVYSFPWSTPQATKEKWKAYYQEQQENKRIVGILERDKKLLGYGSLLFQSKYPLFDKIPEINDVWIHQAYRQQRLGTLLIKWLEELARHKGYKEVGIGVGLYADYGPAQRLYFQLGYRPDGKGLTYQYQTPTPGQAYPLDDELILWLKKTLPA